MSRDTNPVEVLAALAFFIAGCAGVAGTWWLLYQALKLK